jgi:uncharacterized damage-inducible protein DinB
MKSNGSKFAVLALAVAVLACASFAQGGQAPAPTAPTTPAEGKAESLRNFSDAADKIIRLAEAVPADKYTWRPGEGVRSVSEVFLHVAGGCYNIPRRFGAALPAGIQVGQGFDKQTAEKEKVLEILRAAVAHAKGAYLNVAEADLDKTAPWLGGRAASFREIMFFLASHTHEHLGQSIAYARMAGVTPPWTEEAQQRQAQPAKRPGN